MAKTFYTIDDLYNFCKENHFEKFSSAEKGAPLIIQSFGTFESSKPATDGIMSVKLKSCHTGKNRNQSGISDEIMDLYKNSFMGKPILGAIYKTDTGEYEFRAHDMELVENGDDVEINYIEQPIGVISQTAEPYLQYDENMDKNYLMVEGTIFTDYSKAGEILERRKTCKCSVEIAVEEMSYNCKEDYLSIDKFHFCGVTILGYQQDGVTEIQEGMEGSKITIDDFSESNSMFSMNANYPNKLVETLDKLNETLSSFHKTHIQKEGGEIEMDNFENTVVVEEEVKTSDETTEEVVEEITTKETSTSEDNEVVETEACGKKKKCSEEDESEEVDESEEGEPEVKEQEACGGKKRKKCSIAENGDMTVEFSISHEEIRNGLYSLLIEVEETDNDYYYIRSVYDNDFIYEGWISGKLYRQSYSKEGDNISLGYRTEVFEIIVTAEEKEALEKLKSDYAALVEFKQNIENAELKAQKDEVFANASYEVLADNEAFEELKKNAENFSLEEVTTKAKLIFADYVQSIGSFSAKNVEPEQTHKVGYNFGAEPEEEYAPYGSILPAKKKKKK